MLANRGSVAGRANRWSRQANGVLHSPFRHLATTCPLSTGGSMLRDPETHQASQAQLVQLAADVRETGATDRGLSAIRRHSKVLVRSSGDHADVHSLVLCIAS